MVPNGKTAGYFGRLVIGDEAAAQEFIDAQKGVDYFGPLVVGPSEPERPRHAPKAVPVTVSPREQLSFPKLKEALEDNPFILDTMIEAEFQRAEGARKPALQLFVKVESAKGQPREDVLARLQAALKPAAPVPVEA